ncbi:predicted protein [Nematostella vectensis]|uniref:Uncharacterized protein n=1 Tax=Nematostella vectensis TaxID=45351 RepID=A7SST0_NEMVE|nr:predicted protein [Nematostella vectensis]|eukprot:XP_001625331.1 predicted protein [Nematostella vectensis]
MASCDPVKMEKSYKRQKHRCPVPACQKEVIHLPRHLITVHKWSREKALEALSVFDLRAKRTKSEAVPEQRAKRTYKRRVCSFPGCNLIVRRLHNHLNAKHKLSRHDERYKQLLKESRWEEIGEDFQEECVVEISSDTESEPEQEPDPQSQSQSKGKGQSQSKSSQSSTMSSNEEEMCLQEIHRKSEKAKAIMRGGQVDQHKYSSSDDDSDEVIPSSPIGKKRSIFLKRALADIHTDTPKVHAIIKDVDPDELRIDSILNKKHLRDKWLQKLERNRKPGTCKAYLGSLSRFLRFLVVEKLEDLKLTEEHVTKVRVQVQEWSASFKKPFKERRWEKHQEDLEKLITPEDVQKFSKSAPVRAAISTLGRYMEKEGSPGQTDFCTVRDHLITRLCIENACRAGPLANMTLRDLDRATKDGDEMIVTILKHKTSASAGPAHVVLSPTVFTWLKALEFLKCGVRGNGGHQVAFDGRNGLPAGQEIYDAFKKTHLNLHLKNSKFTYLWLHEINYRLTDHRHLLHFVISDRKNPDEKPKRHGLLRLEFLKCGVRGNGGHQVAFDGRNGLPAGQEIYDAFKKTHLNLHLKTPSRWKDYNGDDDGEVNREKEENDVDDEKSDKEDEDSENSYEKTIEAVRDAVKVAPFAWKDYNGDDDGEVNREKEENDVDDEKSDKEDEDSEMEMDRGHMELARGCADEKGA